MAATTVGAAPPVRPQQDRMGITDGLNRDAATLGVLRSGD